MSIDSATITIFLLTLTILSPFCQADYVLGTDERLNAGSSLEYAGYTLTMQDDCNLVLYEFGSDAVWSTKTDGNGNGCYLTMQSDGNLVVYSPYDVALWSSNTARAVGEYVLVLQFDRNLVIYGSSIWSSGSYAVNGESQKLGMRDFHILKSNDRLYSGNYLKYGGYVLEMQEDCNLVLYEDENSVWSTNTTGKAKDCYLDLLSDGNLVVYDSDEAVVWESNTATDEGSYVLVLQSNRNLVIYGSSIWSSGTNIYSLAVSSGNALDSNTTSNQLLSSA